MLSTRYPPIDGPNDTDAAEAIAQNPSAIPRCSGGNTLLTIAIPTGMIAPQPSPSITRQKINSSIEVELPHMNEPKVKTNRERK